MATYLRGKGGRFQIDGVNLRVSSWSAKIEREEHDATCYEDSGFTRRQLGVRTCEVQFEAVWVSTEDLLGDYFGLANLEEEDSQDDGWEILEVKLYPDYSTRTDLYIEMPVATLLGATIDASVDGAVRLKGTIKNQGYFAWKGP